VTSAETISIATPRGSRLRGLLDQPKKPGGTAVALAPGQAYPMDRPIMARTAQALAASGVTALRFDWAYLTAGNKPSPDLATEVEDFRAAIDHVRRLPGIWKTAIAGKSLGGHVALRCAALDPTLAGAAILTFSLHDENSDRLRPGALVLREVTVPVLIVSGDSDPICSMGRLKSFLPKLPRKPEVVIVRGGHGFETKDAGETERNIDAAGKALVNWVKRL
jgi:predicted alpha/beta-hydrolase family hydrolase